MATAGPGQAVGVSATDRRGWGALVALMAGYAALFFAYYPPLAGIEDEIGYLNQAARSGPAPRGDQRWRGGMRNPSSASSRSAADRSRSASPAARSRRCRSWPSAASGPCSPRACCST